MPSDLTSISSPVESATPPARRVRIGLLLADYMSALDWMKDLAEEWGSHEKWFHDFLAVKVPHTYYATPTSRVQVTFRHFDCWGEQLPSAADLKELDCCIITGSRSAAYETAPWILTLAQWIRDYHTKTKIIGFCFGHQIVNQALGGHVALNPLGIEEGTAVITLGPAFHRIFKTTQTQMRLCLGHQDVVETPATGGEVLGWSDKCAVQGVAVGANVLTFQPHPEILASAMIAFLHRRWSNAEKAREMYTGGEEFTKEVYEKLQTDLTDAEVKGVDDMWLGAKLLGWIMGGVEDDAALETRRVQCMVAAGKT